MPVVLEADEVGRYSPDAESTVYFCALEALQNVAKHARATRAVIRLAGNGDGLSSRSPTTARASRRAGRGPGRACRA